jgi:hypothetical protein
MKNEAEQLEALKDIRRMMKESSRFLSLSGLSGILAGLYALAGAYTGSVLIARFNAGYPRGTNVYQDAYSVLAVQLLSVCFGVLALSLLTALILSGRKARKRGHKLFDHSSKNLMWSMAIPLFAGGMFCLALLQERGDYILLICPVMLLFYGLALIGSSRHTLDDIKYLGYLEVALGLVACFYRGHGLFFWSLGFGALHVIYGTIMWFKYDRKD